MGKDPSEFKSVASHTYASKGGLSSSNSDVLSHLKKDLRSSHFSMGNSGPEVASSQTASYRPHMIDSTHGAEGLKMAQKMRDANFELGPGPKKLTSVSTYGELSRNTKKADYDKKDAPKVDARATNIRTFKSEEPQVSEASSKFTPF